MKKVAIFGAHSAGKTSLAYILSAHFKMSGLNVKLIHESVRENCPFPINENANEGTCLWNFHKQFLNELEAEAQGYEMAVCDRSVMDTFVYFHAANPASSITKAALLQTKEWIPTYNLMIYLEPSEDLEVISDGIRATDKEYQKIIRDGFRKMIEEHHVSVKEKILSATSADVFVEKRRENLIRKAEAFIGDSIGVSSR